MTPRLIMTAALLAAGCGDSRPTPAPVADPKAGGKAAPLPPEVELDPAAAAEKRKAVRTKSRP